jgi:hypothetical protein
MALDPENNEWRISQGPSHLLVLGSWFTQRFRQASLYFFDPSARILVPEPVFVPRGVQFASALVDGLLEGPSHKLTATEQSYLPTDLRSQVSVLVSADGTARVDLTSDTDDAPMPTAQQTEMLVAQLAWTLGQDPTINHFKVTIDDRPLQLPGETEFSVQDGHQYAPYLAGSTTQLFGLQDGLMVAGSPQNLAPVTGPFGQTAYGLRTIATDLKASRVAGVSTDGHTLWLGKVKDTGKPARRLTSVGEDLLRPAWDFSGRLWEVDRTSHGAVVYYLHHHQLQPIEIRGISGEDVKHFLVSRDGSRLIAVIRESAEQDQIVVSRIQVTGDGQVAAVLGAKSITDPEKPEGQIRDIAWRSPTSIAILRQLSRHLFQVHGASVDGANPSGLDASPVPIDGIVAGLAGTPVPGATIYAFEPAQEGAPFASLVDLAGPRANSSDVSRGLTMLSYAG